MCVEFHFLGDENVLKLDGSDCCTTTLNILKTTEFYVYFIFLDFFYNLPFIIL